MLNDYGRVSEFDQAALEARRRSRRRLTIIGISAAILVVIIVTVSIVATRQRSGDSTSGSSSAMSTTIKAICANTLYPDKCIESLAPYVDGKSLDPVAIFKIAVQVAMKELDKVSKRINELESNPAVDKMSKDALGDCHELVGLAIDQLNDSMGSPDLTSTEIVDDLKTWLSAALTYQQTCIDGFVNASRSLSLDVSGAFKNSTELTSNSLAILTAYSNILDSVNLRRRRLMSIDDDEFPSWVSMKDRKLLQSSSNPRRFANIVVAKDGSGRFKTITSAIAAVPSKSTRRTIIYVKKGTYFETVKIPKNKWNILMVGDGKDATLVSGRLNFVDGTTTFRSATFAVQGKGFIGMDMGFLNTAGPHKHQAVAFLSDSDKSILYRCRFDAFQDTLYTHSLRQFYRDCSIFGTVDFIFGNAAALLQNCWIAPRMPMPGQQDTLTAQGKIDPNQNTGISIHNCNISPLGKLEPTKVYLGRPWKKFSTTVIMRSFISNVVVPAGWLEWMPPQEPPSTIFYAEFQNSGPGSSTKNRVRWKGIRRISLKQATQFTAAPFLGGTNFISSAGIPFKAGL